MGKFKLNDNVVILDEKSLHFALGYTPYKGTKEYNILLIAGGKIVKEARINNLHTVEFIYTVEFNFPSGPQNFDIYEKRLCLKINSSNSGLKIKKSNHFFTNMFLLEEKKEENKDKVKNDVDKIPPKKKREDDLIKLIREIKNSENLCTEIPLEANF